VPFSPLKWLLRISAAIIAGLALYFGVTFWQVWAASRWDQTRPVQAIVVLGAAQYNGRPSPVLVARLDHAYQLWHRGISDVIVVTGGRQPGDQFTEATASANYLLARGVPDAQVLREVSGRNSWQSLAAAAGFLKTRGRTEVLLVSDPFHDLRISLMAGELGLRAHVSPTRTSPIKGASAVGHMAKESAEVAVGRIIGFRRLVGVGQRVRAGVPSG
jgi:uncharacterized SAM-binding protein YcdF (DUF218 family)